MLQLYDDAQSKVYKTWLVKFGVEEPECPVQNPDLKLLLDEL